LQHSGELRPFSKLSISSFLVRTDEGFEKQEKEVEEEQKVAA
jgi:hypothetical protein